MSSEGSLACHTYCDTGQSFYNGHLRELVTFTFNAVRLAVGLSPPVLTTWVCRSWDSNTLLFSCWANALTQCATAVKYTCFGAFGSGAVTTFFNDLGLSWLRFEHPTLHLWGERSHSLGHRRGSVCLYVYLHVWSFMHTRYVNLSLIHI